MPGNGSACQPVVVIAPGPLVTLNRAAYVQVAVMQLKPIEEVEWIVRDQLAP